MAKKGSSTLENLHPHHVVWLDENIENYTDKQSMNQLLELDSDIELYSNKTECIDYIKRQNDKNTKLYIIFIVSAALNQQAIPEIHEYKCILAIFIFSPNSDPVQGIKYSKHRATCSNTPELINRIQNFINRHMISIDFSLFNNKNTATAETTSSSENGDEQHLIRNIKEDQARFLWFYKCNSFMIEIEDDNPQAKKEMISYLREKISDQKRALKTLDEFENQSMDDNAKNAIWWYTNNSIIFRCINETLAKGYISSIYRLRYIIRLLCRQLKDVHKQFRKSNTCDKLHLFRGQRLKLSQILLISQHKNDLISFNGFLSTTSEEDVAKKFCYSRPANNDEAVIFEIDIDMTNKNTIVLADITKFSQFPDEEETLISIGSIFRIESVDFDDKSQLYRIHLSLSQHDQLTINEYIEQTFTQEMDSVDQSVLFGKLLFDMGEYEFAIEYLKNALQCLSDKNNHYRPTYLNNIGVCYNQIGKHDEAFKHYKVAIKIYEQINNDRGVGACCHNIASLYYEQKTYDNALKWALQALDKRRNSPLEKASTLDLLGCIQLAQQDSEAAINNLQEALKIRLKYLGRTNKNHPDIGMSYHNLGRVDSRLSYFIDAQNNYSRAAEIFRHNYPKTHPLVIQISQSLEQIKRYLGE